MRARRFSLSDAAICGAAGMDDVALAVGEVGPWRVEGAGVMVRAGGVGLPEAALEGERGEATTTP